MKISVAIALWGSLVLTHSAAFAQTAIAAGSPPCEPRARFTADPVEDGAILTGSYGFAALSEAVISTGEIRPQQIDARFDTRNLLWIDRGAISQDPDSAADALSTAGAAAAIGFAALDPVLTIFRGGREAALVDAIIYAEAIGITWGLTNIAKIAFRRPRPIAYIERNRAVESGQDPTIYNNTSTDSSLSFFSGHAALTASVAATATYLAFARATEKSRPWITLAMGIGLTTFVSFERVQAGEHFPTDVIAGSLAGAGVGFLTAHLHREFKERRPVWVGAAPTPGGGSVTLSGFF